MAAEGARCIVGPGLEDQGLSVSQTACSWDEPRLADTGSPVSQASFRPGGDQVSPGVLVESAQGGRSSPNPEAVQGDREVAVQGGREAAVQGGRRLGKEKFISLLIASNHFKFISEAAGVACHELMAVLGVIHG